MKVEVSIVKKPESNDRKSRKVEVILAKAKRMGYCIPVPVRPVARDADTAEDTSLPAECVQEIAEDIADYTLPCEDMPDPFFSLEENSEEPIDEEFLYDGECDETEDEIDEDELLALIAEEEAEMAAQPADRYSAASDTWDYADDASDKEYVDELACEVQELVDGLAEPEELEDRVCVGDETQEPTEELTDADEFDKYGGDSAEDGDIQPDDHAPMEQYMRYFDRSTSGERVEVNDQQAAGQEIICVDGESGKISRVCGFIKHEKNNPLPTVEELLDGEN